MVFDYLEWPDAKNARCINRQACNLISKIPGQYEEYDRWGKVQEKQKAFCSDHDPLALFLDIHWEQFRFPHIPKPDFQKHNHNDLKHITKQIYRKSRLRTLRIASSYPCSKIPKKLEGHLSHLRELNLSNSYVDQLPSNLSWRCHVVFGDRSKFSRSARAIRWIQETISRCLDALAISANQFPERAGLLLWGISLTLPLCPYLHIIIITQIAIPIFGCTLLGGLLWSFIGLIACSATLALLTYLLGWLCRILEPHINRFLRG